MGDPTERLSGIDVRGGGCSTHFASWGLCGDPGAPSTSGRMDRCNRADGLAGGACQQPIGIIKWSTPFLNRAHRGKPEARLSDQRG